MLCVLFVVYMYHCALCAITGTSAHQEASDVGKVAGRVVEVEHVQQLL